MGLYKRGKRIREVVGPVKDEARTPLVAILIQCRSAEGANAHL